MTAIEFRRIALARGFLPVTGQEVSGPSEPAAPDSDIAEDRLERASDEPSAPRSPGRTLA